MFAAAGVRMFVTWQFWTLLVIGIVILVVANRISAGSE